MCPVGTSPVSLRMATLGRISDTAHSDDRIAPSNVATLTTDTCAKRIRLELRVVQWRNGSFPNCGRRSYRSSVSSSLHCRRSRATSPRPGVGCECEFPMATQSSPWPARLSHWKSTSWHGRVLTLPATCAHSKRCFERAFDNATRAPVAIEEGDRCAPPSVTSQR